MVWYLGCRAAKLVKPGRGLPDTEGVPQEGERRVLMGDALATNVHRVGGQVTVIACTLDRAASHSVTEVSGSTQAITCSYGQRPSIRQVVRLLTIRHQYRPGNRAARRLNLRSPTEGQRNGTVRVVLIS